MKKLYILLIGLMMCFSLNSCSFEAYPTTQDDIYVSAETDIVQSNIDYNIVIRYGRPYYYNGSLLYYIYDNLYYYPYYYNNYWYFRVYRKLFPYTNYRPYFRPHRYDYRFNRSYHNPRSWYRYEPNHNRPNINRPNNSSRPSTRPSSRPSTRPSTRTQTMPRNNSHISRPTIPSRGGSSRGGRGR